MKIDSEAFLETIDETIHSKHLLKNIFYHAWSQGKLTQECLKEYAKEYYHHVKAFPTYLSAVHSHTEDQHTRRVLLQNLMEEEGGSPNHPELWRQFTLALGATEAEIDHHIPSIEMMTLIETFKEICLEGTVGEGVAALYAYESQIPEICISKIEGLKKFYGLTDRKSWEYFSVHIAADKEHAAQERILLGQHVHADNAEAALFATNRILDCLWNFLSSMCERYQVSCVVA